MENIIKFFKSQAWLIIVTLLTVGLFLYIFIPKLGEYQKITKDIQVQNQKISVLSRKLNDLNSLSEKELQDNVDLSLKALPAEKDFYPLVLNIKNIFNQEGVLLPEFQLNVGLVSTGSAETAGGAKKNKFDFFSIRVSFSGQLEKVEKIISRLEKSLPLLAVDSFKINSETLSAGEALDYTGTMEIKSYYSLLPKTLEAIDKELPKIDSAQKKQLESLSAFEYFTAEEVFQNEAIVGRENPFPSY